MSNAPFEQTYRITVALPRDQLYVVRVGAKTKLDQILDMTCAAKQLDRDKFHFRHPGAFRFCYFYFRPISINPI